MSKNTFIIIPTELLMANVSAEAKLLHGIIASFTANGKPCLAGNKKLNEMIGGKVTERSIRNYLYQLQRNGLISISGKGHSRRLTAVKFLPVKQPKTSLAKTGGTGVESAVSIDLFYVSENIRNMFSQFLDHCRELGKPITEKIAKAKYYQLQQYASSAFRNNSTGRTMVDLSNEIIRRAISGGYTNFSGLPQLKAKVKNQSGALEQPIERKTGSPIPPQEKRSGTNGGIKIGDAINAAFNHPRNGNNLPLK